MTAGPAMQQAEVRAWSAPPIDGTTVLSGRGRRMTEAQREEERRIHAEAEAAGKAAGLAAARKEMAPLQAALDEAVVDRDGHDHQDHDDPDDDEHCEVHTPPPGGGDVPAD